MSDDTIKVIIGEDHELTRLGLSYALQKLNGIEVVGEAEDGEQVLALIEKTKPDIVLLDVEMPNMNGIIATQRIKAKFPELRVVMLTSHAEGELVYASLAAGADAYCMKDIKGDRLVQVLEMVAQGAVWLDPTIARMVMNALPVKLPGEKEIGSLQPRYVTDLTEREQEVLKLIAQGKTNKEISDKLTITIHTVKAHVCNIIQKLAVDDRTQAAVKAIREGLVKPEYVPPELLK